MSDLMVDFPPISKEDHPEVLAYYVTQHYKDIGDVIAWSQIPSKANAPLKISRKMRKKDESDEEEIDEKPKKKQANKDKASKSAALDLQEEVADLEPIQVLEKRTRGGTSEAGSPASKKKKVVK